MAVLTFRSRSGWTVRICAALAGVSLWLAGSAPARAGGETGTALEYAVKANYLYKFAPFVTWPPAAFATPTAPFNLCIVGEDPFGPMLDQAAQGQQAEGHPVVIRRAAVFTPGMACHLLFVGRPKGQSTSEALRLAAGQPVLTVTDASRGVAGGMIEFVLKDGRVRFDVNLPLTEADGLQVSSKLLSVAFSVRKSVR